MRSSNARSDQQELLHLPRGTAVPHGSATLSQDICTMSVGVPRRPDNPPRQAGMELRQWREQQLRERRFVRVWVRCLTAQLSTHTGPTDANCYTASFGATIINAGRMGLNITLHLQHPQCLSTSALPQPAPVAGIGLPFHRPVCALYLEHPPPHSMPSPPSATSSTIHLMPHSCLWPCVAPQKQGAGGGWPDA